MEASGLTVVTTPDGALRLQLDRLAWHDVGLKLGPLTVHVDLAEATSIKATLQPPADGSPWQLRDAQAAVLRIEGLALRCAMGSMPRPAGPWQLDAFAHMNGTLHAFVTDAAWIVDADVTVPITDGRIDFNGVRVSHFGPDSSMGVSHLGVYVDAPNGRTYLYQFSAAHVPGVRFERRGALLAARVADRGELALQDFLECALRQAAGSTPLGSAPHDAGAKLDRTRLRGELQLGDGVLGAGPMRLTLAGRAQGSNRVELSAAALSHTLTLRLPTLLASDAAAALLGLSLRAGEISGALGIELGHAHIALDARQLTLRKLAAGEQINAGDAGLHSAAAGVK